MRPALLPSGRQRGIAFILPDDWTPQQAQAVVELLDDLHQRLCAHYQIPLHDLLRQQRAAHRPAEIPLSNTTDPPF